VTDAVNLLVSFLHGLLYVMLVYYVAKLALMLLVIAGEWMTYGGRATLNDYRRWRRWRREEIER
jgi:hypothetical protein